MALVMFFLIFFYQMGFVVSQCQNGFYYHGTGCLECGLLCKNCGNICFQCLHLLCPDEICAYNNCTGSSCSNIACATCPDGYYLDILRARRCYPCSNPYCKCSTADDCTGCIPGKYNTNNFCQNNCSRNCTICFSSSDCTECVLGKYGASCQSYCITACSDGSCDKVSGSCLQGCQSGQFLNDRGICEYCPYRCSTCKDHTNCISCNNTPLYRWGSVCQYDCVGCKRVSCSKDHGCSSGCDINYYRIYSSVKNGYECIHCPVGCLACINATHCLSCDTGTWGNICQYNCSGCIGQCDMIDGACSIGCVLGYYQELKAEKQFCAKCPENCEICIDGYNCARCKAGFYPKNSAGCVKCSENCRNRICNPTNGTCTEECENRWFGNYCNISCPSACFECVPTNTFTCTICIPGFYGIVCENNCSVNCKNETCDKINGSCQYGCSDTYWGSVCNMPCEEGCEEGICNDVTGECIHGCKNTHYGFHCKNKCYENCKTNCSLLRNCDATTGTCQWGCKDGYFGISCTEECENCRKNVCYQHNGTCKDGCATGFTGQNCRKIMEGSQTSTTNPAVSGLSAGVGILAIVAVVAITLNILQCMKRRRNPSNAPNNTRGINPSAETVGANDYQDLRHCPSDDNTYSVLTTK